MVDGGAVGRDASRRTVAWEARGAHLDLCGHRIFAIDQAPLRAERAEPLVVLHGFPTSSFDFHLVLDALAAHRRVVLCDFAGYGLSAKPDLAYTIGLQADIVAALVRELGITRLALLTHDMGDTVGGELLARQMEGAWVVDITARVVTNGSIYIEMAHLSPGQLLLLQLPDAKLPGAEGTGAEGTSAEGTGAEGTGAPAPDGGGFVAGLRGTLSPRSDVPDAELEDAWELMTRNGGHLLLARLIRYIEERRRNQGRFTGAIERHPSPLTVVWGEDDPIAVVAMAQRLADARPATELRLLDGVGHFPMIEDPPRFCDAVLGALG